MQLQVKHFGWERKTIWSKPQINLFSGTAQSNDICTALPAVALAVALASLSPPEQKTGDPLNIRCAEAKVLQHTAPRGSCWDRLHRRQTPIMPQHSKSTADMPKLMANHNRATVLYLFRQFSFRYYSDPFRSVKQKARKRLPWIQSRWGEDQRWVWKRIPLPIWWFQHRKRPGAAK